MYYSAQCPRFLMSCGYSLGVQLFLQTMAKPLKGILAKEKKRVDKEVEAMVSVDILFSALEKDCKWKLSN